MAKFSGRVVKISGNKTISVLFERSVVHSVYGKVVKKRKKYQVHDEKCFFKVGEVVVFCDSRPISKRKKYTVLY